MSDQAKFPHEVVDLPSKGLLYPKENPLSSGTVEMKYMSAREEDILTNQSFIRQGVVLDKLFKSLKALNSNAFPEGSKKNMVACSPGSPLNRT